MMPTSDYTVLVVNRLPRNLQLLTEFLGKEGYATVSASSYEELDHILSQATPIDGALVDIAGYDSGIWTRCEQLRAAKIPFLVFSPQLSSAIQQAGIAHGARSVMVKPLVIKELVGIIKSILAE